MADPNANDVVDDVVDEEEVAEEASSEPVAVDPTPAPAPADLAPAVAVDPPLSFQEQLSSAFQALTLALGSIDNSNAGVVSAASTVKTAEAHLEQAQKAAADANTAMSGVRSSAVAAAETLMRVLRDWLTTN